VWCCSNSRWSCVPSAFPVQVLDPSQIRAHTTFWCRTVTTSAGIENFISLPVSSSISTSGDAGRPHVRTYPDSPLATKMADLAESVIAEIIGASSSTPEVVEYDEAKNVVKFEGTKISAGSVRKSLNVQHTCGSETNRNGSNWPLRHII